MTEDITAAPINLTDLLGSSLSVTLSSTYASQYGGDKLLDDDTGTFAHTLNGLDEWVEMDFGQDLEVTGIVLTNRDFLGGRLNGAEVSLLDEFGAVMHTFAPISGAENGEVLTLELPSAVMARSVYIDGADNTYLQLAEIDVMGLQPADYVPPINLTDLLGGSFTVTLSSEFPGGYGGDKLLDDDTGTFAHTLNGLDEWVEMDFGQDLEVTGIVLTNRDFLGGRLNGAEVSLLDEFGAVMHTFAPISGAENGEVLTLELPSAVMARSVYIDGADNTYLQLAEIDVMGLQPADYVPPINLTDLLGGSFTVTLSSEFPGGYGGDKLLDDDTGTFAHTLNGLDEWVQMDFGQDLEVTGVVLTNRDFLGGRLNGAEVSLLDEFGAVMHTFAPISGAENGEVLTLELGTAVTARSVYIDGADSTYLQLAEIDVMGLEPAGYVPPINLTDLLGGSFTVTLSSEFPGGYGGDKLLDDDTGTFAHTLNGLDEWVEMDFGQDLEVTGIVLTNRDFLGGRLNGAEVSLLDEFGAVMHTFAPISGAENGEVLTLELGTAVTARSVYIDGADSTYLQLAEIDVMGLEPAGYVPPINLTDLLGGSFTVTLSSEFPGGYGGDKLLDDDTGTFAHTLNGLDEWVEMDFGQDLEVTGIVLTNRDFLGGRLNGAEVSLLDEFGAVMHTFAPISGAENGEVLTLDLGTAVTARSLYIDGADNTYLQFAEIDVFGLDPTIAPSITSTSEFIAYENTTEVGTLQASRPVTWTITGGVDQALFDIDIWTGALAFLAPPDFEAPGDSGTDNIYNLTVTFTDTNDNAVSQEISIQVANVVESAPSTSFTNFAVFGDSLSDNGNFTDLAADFFVRDEDGELIYTVPFQFDGGDGSVRTYDTRAFTDGTAYADTLAGLLSLEAAYENYAFGGAEALGSKLGESYINEYSSLPYTKLDGTAGTFSILEDTDAALAAYGNFDINLTAQVDRYLEAYPTGAPADTLAVLNIGANDLGKFDTNIINILLGGVNAFAEDLGAQIETQARRLADNGVSGIALYTLPVAEFFIGYDDLSWWLEQPLARDLLDSVRDQINFRAQLLNGDSISTEVVRIDIMSEEILADMQTHGFLFQGPYLFGYSGDPIWTETSPGIIEPTFNVNAAATAYRPEQILFFDEIHPSTALHDMLAIFSSESLATDEVFASSGADIITGSAVDSFVLARGGSDEVNLGAGDDVALGGRGNDTLRGEDGSDLLIGGVGGDRLEGGAGSDLLAGSGGDDQLFGGDDADMLLGGLGSDSVFGDGGDDVFIFFEDSLWGGSGGSTDLYDGGAGDDDILLVFLASPVETVMQDVSDSTTTLTFADTSTLTANGIETIELYMGLPDDPESPLTSLALSMQDDLLQRYEEGELWGIV